MHFRRYGSASWNCRLATSASAISRFNCTSEAGRPAQSVRELLPVRDALETIALPPFQAALRDRVNQWQGLSHTRLRHYPAAADDDRDRPPFICGWRVRGEILKMRQCARRKPFVGLERPIKRFRIPWRGMKNFLCERNSARHVPCPVSA